MKSDLMQSGAISKVWEIVSVVHQGDNGSPGRQAFLPLSGKRERCSEDPSSMGVRVKSEPLILAALRNALAWIRVRVSEAIGELAVKSGKRAACDFPIFLDTLSPDIFPTG